MTDDLSFSDVEVKVSRKHFFLISVAVILGIGSLIFSIVQFFLEESDVISTGSVISFFALIISVILCYGIKNSLGLLNKKRRVKSSNKIFNLLMKLGLYSAFTAFCLLLIWTLIHGIFVVLFSGSLYLNHEFYPNQSIVTIFGGLNPEIGFKWPF